MMRALAGAAFAPLPLPPTAPVTLRSVRHDDAPLLDAFVRALSPQSRYARFHAGVRELSAAQLQRITHFDPRVELALIATQTGADGREVALGEALYAPSYDDDADDAREFGIAVADGAQGRGIGTRLLRALLSHAARAGVSRLYGDLVRDNLPMLALARSLGFDIRRHPDDARLQRVQTRLQAAPQWRM